MDYIDGPYKRTIKITGIISGDLIHEVEKMAGATVYLKGAQKVDHEPFYVDVQAGRVGIVMANINATPGLTATEIGLSN